VADKEIPSVDDIPMTAIYETLRELAAVQSAILAHLRSVESGDESTRPLPRVGSFVMLSEIAMAANR
jgi:hypothetical protein